MKSRLALGMLALLSLPAWTGAQSKTIALPVGYSLSSAYIEDSGDGILALTARSSSRLPTGVAFSRLSDPAGELFSVTGMLEYYSVRHLAENRFILRGIGNPPREPEAIEPHYSEVVLVEVRQGRAETVTERPISVYVDYETIQRPTRDGKYWIESERYVWVEGKSRPQPISEERLGAGLQFGIHSLETGELEKTLYVEGPARGLAANPLFTVMEPEGPVLAVALDGLVHVLRFSSGGMSSEYLLGAPEVDGPCGQLLKMDWGSGWQDEARRFWAKSGGGRWEWLAFDLWDGGLNALSPIRPQWRSTGLRHGKWRSPFDSRVLSSSGGPTYVYPHSQRGLLAVWIKEGRYKIEHSWRDLRVPGVVDLDSRI